MSTTASPAGTNQEQAAHFIALLKKFNTVMLVTHHGENGFHARPMAIADVEEDGRIWFFTAANTGKVHEIENESHAHLTAQDGDVSFLALSGRASLVADRQKIEELWKEPYRVWFPGGKDDPSIELISLRPVLGEYWDNSGLNRCKYAWEAAKAYVTGSTPKIDEKDQHGVVRL